jgi:hypothetical protein
MSEYSRFAVAEDFSFLSPALNNLSSDIKKQLVEVVYCWRDSVESVSVVTENLDCLRTILKGNVPNEISEGAVYQIPRYGVDLESIGTDELRLYRDDAERDDISAIGYKFDSNGNVIEREEYWRDKTGNKPGVLLDRYDASNNLISSKEPDSIVVEKNNFLGNMELADKVEQIASEKKYIVVFANKIQSNESYIRIRRPHSMLGAHIEAMRK